MKHRAARLELSGRTFEVTRLAGREAVSTLFHYDMVVEVPLPLPPLADVLGAVAALSIVTDLGTQRVVTGIVASARARATDGAGAVLDGGARSEGTGRIELTLRPKAFALTLGRDCYASQEVDVIDVAKDVLANYPDPIRWSIARSYPKHPYRAQYREDDWTYVSRLFEEEGIFYWFAHDDGSQLVVADDSRAAEDIAGGASLRFIEDAEASGLETAVETVSELQSFAVSAPGRFAVHSFDPARPLLSVRGSVGSSGHEVYDAPGGGPRDPNVAQQQARTMAEASAAARAGIVGTTTSVRLVPGQAIEVFDHPVASLNRRFFVTSVEVRTREDGTWEWIFTAIPSDVPFRARAVTPQAKQAGLQLGQVIGPAGQEVFPDDNGRIRVQLHWDRLGAKNEKAGTWMRVAQRCTPGSMLLPRIGWNVATFNEEGGVDAPSIICRIHDADHPPEYPLPANMTRVVYKTATTPGGGSHNEIYFEDKMGAEEMFIHASKDLHVRIRHVRTENVGNDALLAVGNDKKTEVGDTYTMDVAQDQTRTIGANQKIVVQDTRTKSVQGSDTNAVGGSRKLDVGDSFNLRVKGNRAATAPVVLDLTLGTVSASAKDMSVLVGGAVVKVSAETVAELAAKVAVQGIGGAKVEIAKENRSLTVGKRLYETVGAVMSLKAGGKFTESASKTNQWKVGAKISGKAPLLHVEGEKKIRVKCGASILTITEKSVELEGTELDLTGAKLDADTETIEHN